jgi:hypothetical protein
MLFMFGMLTGMRVIGVTTTLSEEGMSTEAPNLIRPDISRIGVSEITALKYPEGSNGKSAVPGTRTAAAAPEAEETSIDVSV